MDHSKLQMLVLYWIVLTACMQFQLESQVTIKFGKASIISAPNWELKFSCLKLVVYYPFPLKPFISRSFYLSLPATTAMSYTRLRKEEHDGFDTERSQPHTKPPSKTSKTTIISLLAITISLTTCIFVFVNNIQQHPSVESPSPPQMNYQCGTSAAEAKARGCRFDIMSFSWLPPVCDDKEVTEMFLEAGNWTWSRDPQGKHVISQEDVGTGDFEYLFTNYRYHLTHCVYIWQKFHRALFTGDLSRIDGYSAGIGHTEHCSKMLLDRSLSLDHWGIVATTKFPSCGQGMLDKTQQGWFRIRQGEKVFGGDAVRDAHGDFLQGLHDGHQIWKWGLSVFAVLSVCVACNVFKYIKIAPKVTIFWRSGVLEENPWSELLMHNARRSHRIEPEINIRRLPRDYYLPKNTISDLPQLSRNIALSMK